VLDFKSGHELKYAVGFYPVSADTSKKAKIGQKECHVQAKKVQ